MNDWQESNADRDEVDNVCKAIRLHTRGSLSPRGSPRGAWGRLGGR